MAGREIYSSVGISWPMVICFAPVAQETLINKAPWSADLPSHSMESSSICESLQLFSSITQFRSFSA